MADDERRVAEALDPTRYVEHVTRTAMLLEQLARDVSHLRERYDETSRATEGMRTTIAAMERETAVFRSDSTSRVVSLEKDFSALTNRLTWLNRTFVASLIGGAIAIAFKLLEK